MTTRKLKHQLRDWWSTFTWGDNIPTRLDEPSVVWIPLTSTIEHHHLHLPGLPDPALPREAMPGPALVEQMLSRLLHSAGLYPLVSATWLENPSGFYGGFWESIIHLYGGCFSTPCDWLLEGIYLHNWVTLFGQMLANIPCWPANRLTNYQNMTPDGNRQQQRVAWRKSVYHRVLVNNSNNNNNNNNNSRFQWQQVSMTSN